MGDKLRGLYVVLDPAVAAGRNEIDILREALAGGARIAQLRDKTREKGLQLPIAREMKRLCRDFDALFIVNDHVDLALALEADGVHVGPKDLPVSLVRRLVGSSMIVGCSTNNEEEARKAEADGADYVSVGRLFPTESKLDTRPASLNTLRQVRSSVSVPVCAIGGINESNIGQVIDAGADMAAVIAAVIASADILEATRRLAEFFVKRV